MRVRRLLWQRQRGGQELHQGYEKGLGRKSYIGVVLVQGAALIVAATSVAATTAFFAARGILRPLAEKVVSSEMRGVRHTGDQGEGYNQTLKTLMLLQCKP